MVLLKKQRLFAILLLLIVATSAGTVGWVMWIPASPGVLSASPKELRIECKYGDRKEVFVSLKNAGGKPLTISGVSSSCGCTVGTPEANNLAPGSETRLRIDVNASTVGRKSAIVSVAYTGADDRQVIQIPVLIQAVEAPGTRVLSYPRDLTVRCNVVGDTTTKFEIWTLENSDADPDLTELVSTDERCHFRVLGVETSPPDRNGKSERCYRIEASLSESEPFAATATMRFREVLAYQVSNIAIITRRQSRTKVIPSRIELPANVTSSSSQMHEVLLISEVDIDDWKVADKQQFPDWLAVEVETLRSNITRLTLADSRPLGPSGATVQNYELRLDSSAESASIAIHIRE